MKYATKFIENLKSLRQKEEVGNIYWSLFYHVMPIEQLDKMVEYLFQLYKGNDPYFKETGSSDWFRIWHKSIRQTSCFEECYRKVTLKLISDEEVKEWKFLANKFRSGATKEELENLKTEGKPANRLFNAEYDRYLDLADKRRREVVEEPINGSLDSILWNLIYVDKGNNLYKLFRLTFTGLETDEEMGSHN